MSIFQYTMLNLILTNVYVFEDYNIKGKSQDMTYSIYSRVSLQEHRQILCFSGNFVQGDPRQQGSPHITHQRL